MRVRVRVFMAVLLALGLAGAASAQSSELAKEGVKAFIEACVRTTPDFKNSASVIKRRSIPVVSMSDLERGRVPRKAPGLLAVLGSSPDFNNASVCTVVIRGNADRMAAATVEKYIADPAFPYTARIDGGSRLDNGMQTSVLAAFPFGRNNIYAIAVSRNVSFAGYGRATLLVAMSGKINLR